MADQQQQREVATHGQTNKLTHLDTVWHQMGGNGTAAATTHTHNTINTHNTHNTHDTQRKIARERVWRVFAPHSRGSERESMRAQPRFEIRLRQRRGQRWRRQGRAQRDGRRRHESRGGGRCGRGRRGERRGSGTNGRRKDTIVVAIDVANRVVRHRRRRVTSRVNRHDDELGRNAAAAVAAAAVAATTGGCRACRVCGTRCACCVRVEIEMRCRPRRRRRRGKRAGCSGSDGRVETVERRRCGQRRQKRRHWRRGGYGYGRRDGHVFGVCWCGCGRHFV